MTRRVLSALCALTILLSALPLASATETVEKPSINSVQTVDTSYSEGVRAYAADGLWGFTNSDGAWVIDPIYEWVSPFTMGRSVVCFDGLYGLLCITGEWLIAPEYEELTALAFGLYIAQQGDKYGLVSDLELSTTGSQIIYDFTYDSITPTTVSGTNMVAFYTDGSVRYVSYSTLRGGLVSGKVASYQFLLSYGDVPAFTDVSQRSWYALWVDICYDVGLMEGVSATEFAPEQTLSVAEAIKLAAFLESISRGDNFHLQSTSGTDWYSDSVQYCLATGVITSGQFDDYTRAATRLEVAQILAATGAVRSLSNQSATVTIPDMTSSDTGYSAVVSLYKKGIVEGVDTTGSFAPERSITRGEVAAMIGRIARVELR